MGNQRECQQVQRQESAGVLKSQGEVALKAKLCSQLAGSALLGDPQVFRTSVPTGQRGDSARKRLCGQGPMGDGRITTRNTLGSEWEDRSTTGQGVAGHLREEGMTSGRAGWIKRGGIGNARAAQRASPYSSRSWRNLRVF